MTTRITLESVPKLEANSSNFQKQKTAITLLTAILDATNILNSCNNKLKSLLYTGLVLVSKSINLPRINLTNNKDLSRMSRTAQYKKDRVAINNSIYSITYKTKELII